MAINEKAVKTLDEQLYELGRDINILDAIAPLNYVEQRSIFFSSNFSTNPKFLYKNPKLDTFKRKRALFNLPIEALGDDDLYTLYKKVIESYVDKLEQFNSVGTKDFLYNSLRYYGEPNEKDRRNAQFILHLPPSEEPPQATLTAQEIADKFKEFATEHKYDFQLEFNDSMIANALVSGTKIKVNSSANIPENEAYALAHHELGVHLVTSLNARKQPLKILQLGCPANTMSQEGLAILCEYLAGFSTISRLKILALRVMAVDEMVQGHDFRHVFIMLKEQYDVPVDLAFTISARAFRGGGFTKDFLYLKGLHTILNTYESNPNFINLLCGKVSVDCLENVTRLIEKGYLMPPTYISPAISRPVVNDDINRFITHAIK